MHLCPDQNEYAPPGYPESVVKAQFSSIDECRFCLGELLLVPNFRKSVSSGLANQHLNRANNILQSSLSGMPEWAPFFYKTNGNVTAGIFQKGD